MSDLRTEVNPADWRGHGLICVGYTKYPEPSWSVSVLVNDGDGVDMMIDLTADEAREIGRALTDYAKLAAAAERGR
jgi:hypothetical protein